MNKKYKGIIFIVSLLFLAALFQSCNSRSINIEDELDPNLKLFTVKSLIDMSDGISEAEYNNKYPIEVSSDSGITFNYIVNLIGPDGKTVENLKGRGTTDSDGKYKPVINWSKPYNSLACGEYKIQISVFTDAEITGDSTYDTMATSIPCQDSYTVTALYNLSDGINKTEFKQPPFRISTYPGSTVNYTVTLKDSKGNPVKDKNGGDVHPKAGTGIATADTGIFEPSAAEFWPAVDYATLADKCGNYSIEIKMQNPSVGTPKTKIIQITIPCFTVKPAFDSKKGISEAEYAKPFIISAAVGDKVYYRYKIDYVNTDSTGKKTETLKEEVSGEFISTGTDSPAPVWKNKYAALTCKGYNVTVWADNEPITGTATMESVSTFVPCVSAKPGEYITACGDIATHVTPGKTETFWSKLHLKDITGIMRTGEYKKTMKGESCSDICSGYGEMPAFDHLSGGGQNGIQDRSNYQRLVFNSLLRNTCNSTFYGSGAKGGIISLQAEADSFHINTLGFYTSGFSQYIPYELDTPGVMICMCKN